MLHNWIFPIPTFIWTDFFILKKSKRMDHNKWDLNTILDIFFIQGSVKSGVYDVSSEVSALLYSGEMGRGTVLVPKSDSHKWFEVNSIDLCVASRKENASPQPICVKRPSANRQPGRESFISGRKNIWKRGWGTFNISGANRTGKPLSPWSTIAIEIWKGVSTTLQNALSKWVNKRVIIMNPQRCQYLFFRNHIFSWLREIFLVFPSPQRKY